MTFTDAAAEVLRLVGRPLHYKEITDIAIEKNLLSHVGKSPEVTMGARLAATLKKDSGDNPLIRVKPGVFALREWDDKTIKSGLEARKAKKSGKAEADADRDEEGADVAVEIDEDVEAAEKAAGEEAAAKPAAAAPSPSPPPPPRPTFEDDDDEEEEELEPPEPDELMRAEAVAGAAELFDEEEDDDQPILGGADERPGPAPDSTGDGRRRRRRRRRGRGSSAELDRGGAGALPSYTATPAFDSRRDNARTDVEPFRGPQVIELVTDSGAPLDDLAGRELADAIVGILSTFDRGAGPVSLRQIAETAQRRGRLTGDAQLVQSQVAAAVRADNHRRLAAGLRPRFRFAGGRVALTDWLLSGDLARLEQEATAAVERYRDAARRAFARKLAELPGHAFVEVCVLALERLGMGQLRAVRRAGAAGGETHLSGVLRSGEAEVRAAIVIRRDGREVGRERVTELRGALHHYGPATMGWILTSGQVLSGAREEAAIAGTPPVALYDGFGVARLCEEHDVAVVRARMPIAIPDLDFLEALRAS